MLRRLFTGSMSWGLRLVIGLEDNEDKDDASNGSDDSVAVAGLVQ